VDAALAGELDEKRLNALLLDYATVTAANNHRGELRQRSENCSPSRFIGRYATAWPMNSSTPCGRSSLSTPRRSLRR